MKKVTAIIKPFKLDDVKTSLEECGIHSFTVIEAKGCGLHTQYTEFYRGHEYAVNFVPKVEIIIIVQDDEVDNVVKAILEAARTDKDGNGRIEVSHVEQFWNIRTLENEAETR